MRAAPLLLAMLLAFGTGATTGCSSRTTTTTRTVERPSESASDAPGQTETTVTETKESDGPHVGIVSGTIHAIGFILASPFKLIGWLFTVIF